MKKEEEDRGKEKKRRQKQILSKRLEPVPVRVE